MIRHAREEAAMTHGARRRSTSGFYHVVPKGRGDQVIFEDDDDRKLYRYLLADAKRNYGIRIHSYCLMSNHAHLVIEDDNALMSTFMKSVHEQYGSYFADKTGRAGGIFTRPYWSEPIETDAYLLDAVRYVHANPATAGICRASAYEWSSAKDYLGREGLADTEMVLSMLGGRDGFVAFSRQVPTPAKAFAGSRLRGHLTDDEVITIARTALGPEMFKTLKQLSLDTQREAVRQLGKCGLTIRQVTRATGLGYRFVQRAWHT